MTYPPPQGPPQWGSLPVPRPAYLPAVTPRSSGAAVALELVLGIIGIFGVGNIYAGKTAQGVIIMVSFWVLFWVNFCLISVGVGLFTMPLTWIAYMILGPVLAARAVEEYNTRAW
ncbi:hypothetical protein [Micromonospora sp. NPDC004551]|uniref:hypothetical protein n=1 Tax=Micromonospora sp. NPDC004551 TaxID=3154284 RepID=UPI0033A117BC